MFTAIYWTIVLILLMAPYVFQAPGCGWSDVACFTAHGLALGAWWAILILAPLTYAAVLVWRISTGWRRRGLFKPIVVTRKRVARTILVTLPLIPLGLVYLLALILSYFLMEVAFLIGDCMEGASVCDAVAAQGHIVIPIVIGAAIVGFWLLALYWIWIWWARADVSAETLPSAS